MLWWEILVCTPILFGVALLIGRVALSRMEGEKQPFRRLGIWSCKPRCGYQYRYLGHGQWLGPFGSDYPRMLSSREFQESYADCYKHIEWTEA